MDFCDKNMFEGKDKLDIIFYMQEKFDNDVIKNRKLEHLTEQDWIINQTMAMYVELSEMLSETNYKWWKNKKEIDKDKLKEEIIDVLHFFIGLCIKVGMTPDEMLKIYLDKNLENFKRQYGQSAKKGYEIEQDSKKE